MTGDLEPLLQGRQSHYEVHIGHGLGGSQEAIDQNEGLGIGEPLQEPWVPVLGAT